MTKITNEKIKIIYYGLIFKLAKIDPDSHSKIHLAIDFHINADYPSIDVWVHNNDADHCINYPINFWNDAVVDEQFAKVCEVLKAFEEGTYVWTD